MTGLAGGDHLHFTMLVDGHPVNSVEWWDTHWMEDRVLRKIREAVPGAPPRLAVTDAGCRGCAAPPAGDRSGGPQRARAAPLRALAVRRRRPSRRPGGIILMYRTRPTAGLRPPA